MKKNFKNSNCIVTGGAGFIGQNLVRKLIKLGANVVVVDKLIYGAKKENVDPQAKLIVGDVRDSGIFNRLPAKKYDFIFHFAAPSSTVLFTNNLITATDITIRGFLNFLHYAAEQKARFVYPSTGSLYSGIKPPHHEKAELKWEVQNDYAKNKIMLERLTNLYRPEVNALGLRILAGYGPGESHKKNNAGVVFSFCRDMINGHAPVIWGDGNQLRDFIFIADMIEIITRLSLTCPEPIVNVGTGSEISFNDVIRIINKFLGTEIKPKHIPKPSLYLEKTLADTRLLRKYYKKPFTTPENGIKKTLVFLQS